MTAIWFYFFGRPMLDFALNEHIAWKTRFPLHKNNDEDSDDNDEELPEYVKRMYS